MTIPSEPPLEVKLVFARDEYLAALREYALLFPTKTRTWLFEIVNDILIVIVFAIIAAAFIPQTRQEILSLALWFLLGFIALRAIRNLKQSNRVSAEGFDRNPRWRKETIWRFTETGITIASESLEATMKWDYYSKVLDLRSMYLFIEDQRQGAVWRFLPKRAFANPSDEQTFRAMAQRHINLVKRSVL